MNRTMPIALAALVLGISGCSDPADTNLRASNRGVGSSTTASDAVADQESVPTSPYSFGDGNFTATPPAKSDAPRITSAEAYASYRALGVGDLAEDEGVEPTFTLARVTAKNFGGTTSDGAQVSVIDRLSWLIRFAPHTCSYEGHGGGGYAEDDSTADDAPTTAVPTFDCQTVILVDATTGEALSSVTGPLEAWPPAD